MFLTSHQYIERESGRVCTEKLYADKTIGFLYSQVRENAPLLYKLIHRKWFSSVIGMINYETFIGKKVLNNKAFIQKSGINIEECIDNYRNLKTLKEIFERKIRYWECRPMSENPGTIVSPADSRMLAGSLSNTSALFLKNKFFQFEELLGKNKKVWLHAFQDGDFAVFRLTPEKYHYNHTPVTGNVADAYVIEGGYHACNPGAVVTAITPYSKNKRVVTIIDTNIPRGTNIGFVAMIEVVALMIGKIKQCYSPEMYESPQNIRRGLFLKKGQPKSVFCPGSSTTVLLFQKGQIAFAEDVVKNMFRRNVSSRFSLGFGRPLVETDVKVRSVIANCILRKELL